MDLIKILVAAIAATFAMTGFSYVISEAYQKLFKEPELLNKIIQRLGIDLQESTKKISGWILHYAIGVLFVIIYDIVLIYYEL